MEGALFLIALLLLAILITPIIIASGSSSKINRLSDELRIIKEYLKSIKKDVDQLSSTPPPPTPPSHIETPSPTVSQWTRPTIEPAVPPPVPPPVIPEIPAAEPEPEVIPEPVVAAGEIKTKEEIKAEEMATPAEAGQEATQDQHIEALSEEISESALEEEATVYYNSIPAPVAERATTETPPPPPPSQPSVPPNTPPPPRKKTDFEQFIGEKLISIVGIAILVLGIFFSVKWAIDRNLISDAGKVMIGLVSGTILIAVAHRLAKNYRAFSSILAGGGIAVFYFSIYEAYQSYHLLPQTAAFAVMIVITLLAVILSVIYDKKELAVIAIVGGFCTPFFVSNGSGNYQVLFTYLLILNVGMFALAYFKKWNLINIICYCFTMLIFGGWVMQSFDVSKGHAAGGMLFISLFFVIFFGMNIVYNLRHRAKFGAIEISMLLSNSFIYLGFGLYFLALINNGQYKGIFTLSLAAFNFIFAFAFYRRQQVDKNLVFLLIGLVLTFLSLTGPLQLDGNYITLFWASELVVLYWMGTKTGIAILKNASILILALTLVSLGMDWENDYFGVHVVKLPVVFNKAFITSAVVLLAIVIKRHLMKKDGDETLMWDMLSKKAYLQFTGVLLIMLIYITGLLEVEYQSFNITHNFRFREVLVWIYQYGILAALALYFSRRKEIRNSGIIAILTTLALLLYPVANYAVIKLRETNMGTSLYHWHYLLPVAALLCAGLLINFIRKNFITNSTLFAAMAWGGTFIILYIISAESIHIWVAGASQPGFDNDAIVERARKVALPIIWSICSLLLMLLGMRKKLKMFRIISLSLFSLTIAKLFLYDISNVGQGGKIAAFIILGVILLVVSFMYQKIKGLFTDEEAKPNE